MMEPIDGKCPLCDTNLVHQMPNGVRMVFTLHDQEFCDLMTRDRIRMLQRVLKNSREYHEVDRDRLSRAYWLVTYLRERCGMSNEQLDEVMREAEKEAAERVAVLELINNKRSPGA